MAPNPPEPQAHRLNDDGFQVERTVTIRRTAGDLYAAWKDIEQLPRFMRNVRSVEWLSDGRSHWVVNGPAGQPVEWDARVINDVPGRVLAWETLEDAPLQHAGSVQFDPVPDGRGTEVKVTMRYRPPSGALGRIAAAALGADPAKQVAEDLGRFKELMETRRETRP
jgi:uncharacterized membrane protein